MGSPVKPSNDERGGDPIHQDKPLRCGIQTVLETAVLLTNGPRVLVRGDNQGPGRRGGKVALAVYKCAKQSARYCS